MSHKKQDCPAREVQCNCCNKKGHYIKVCHQKTYEKQANVVGADCQSITDSEDDFDYLEQSTVVANKAAREPLLMLHFMATSSKPFQEKLTLEQW